MRILVYIVPSLLLLLPLGCGSGSSPSSVPPAKAQEQTKQMTGMPAKPPTTPEEQEKVKGDMMKNYQGGGYPGIEGGAAKPGGDPPGTAPGTKPN